jgi:hypothetical protein
MENYHRHQKLKQLSKQTQLVDQNFSNGIMLNALAALENLAIYYGYKGKRIFDYYSGYARRDSEQELVKAVVLQLEIFRSSHYNYTTVYSSYDFPKNLTNEQVIKHVKDWKKHIPKQIEIYYDEMLNYLYGNSNVSGISDKIEKKRKEMGPTTEEDLARIARAAPFVNTNMYKQMEKVKQSYEKNGDYDIKAHLNENQEENVDMKDLYNNDQKVAEQERYFNQIEENIESFFKKIQSKSQINESDFKMLFENVDKFQIYYVAMNFGEEKIKYKISLYNSFKGSIYQNLVGIVKEAVINQLLEICERIIACYNKKKTSQIA